jgi:NCAIR mutase (PurE)-related protein
MRPEELESLLADLCEDRITVDDAVRALQRLPVEDLGFARLDTHRELRQGLPEAIFAEGKSASQVVTIATRMLETTTSPVLSTRTPPETAAALLNAFPKATSHAAARLVVLRADPKGDLGTIAVVSAGTSDGPVADEAAFVAEAFGCEVERLSDAGVAGVHRILALQDRLTSADLVIVVAGMEGALPSIVGGMTGAPIVAVPTSVGYGSSFEGLAALLGMLNSCASGVTVVNIDNGFGAAMAALRILRGGR